MTLPRRGRDQAPVYINPYRPGSLLEVACRIAIMSRFESLTAFTGKCSHAFSATSITKALRSLKRSQVEVIENTVNAAPIREDRQHSWGHRQRWYLVSLYDSLHGATAPPGSSLEGSLPSRFLSELVNSGPARSKPEVITRGTALRTYMNELGSSEDLNSNSYMLTPPLAALTEVNMSAVVADVLHDLCIVAMQPMGSGGLEAARQAAEAGTLALDAIYPYIAEGAPTSWRLVRVITEILRRMERWEPKKPGDRKYAPNHPRNPEAVKHKCWELLALIDDTNPPNENRARSLFEEAASNYPDKVASEKDDPLLSRLHRRAISGHTGLGERKETILPVRERVTAAWSYAWRVARASDRSTTPWNPRGLRPWSDLSPEQQRLIGDLARKMREAATDPEDGDAGLDYAGRYLEAALQDTVFWPWPQSTSANDAFERARENAGVSAGSNPFWTDSHEARIVHKIIRGWVSENASLDATVVLPTIQTLCTFALLTIDGVGRREALVALEASGLGAHAAEIFKRVAHEAKWDTSRQNQDNRWLIEVSLFALGWMNQIEAAYWTLFEYASTETNDSSLRIAALHALADMAELIRYHDRTFQDQRVAKASQMAMAIAERTTATGGGWVAEHENKFVRRAALYTVGMLRPVDDELVVRLTKLAADETAEITKDGGDFNTPALARWAANRITTRNAVNEAVEAQMRDPDRPQPGSLRRLDDPWDALRATLADTQRPVGRWELKFTVLDEGSKMQ